MIVGLRELSRSLKNTTPNRKHKLQQDQRKPILLDGRVMVYIKRHPKIGEALTTLPRTVADFARRYRAETKELSRLRGTKPRAVLKIVRSYTFVQAQRLGEVRFDELCRKLNFSRQSPRLSWHKALAKNAGKLLRYADRIPDGDGSLQVLATLDTELLHDLVLSHELHQLSTKGELKKAVAAMQSKQRPPSSNVSGQLGGEPP